MKIPKKKITAFQTKILARYTANKREFPRRNSFNPYRVLVSEVMSQQTQIARILPKFENFVEALPTLEDLADCEKATLLTLRSGLGFNSRALRLQQTATIIVDTYDSIVPDDRAALLALPGIGSYTSASICAFSYNKEVPVIDTNIRRVLIWELGLPVDIGTKDLEDIAIQCVPKGKSNDRHNALMDYGSLIATAKMTGIRPLSKQSRFKGSDREVRGRVLKQLTGSERSLTKQLIAKEFPNKEITSILRGMVRDDLIRLQDENVEIASN